MLRLVLSRVAGMVLVIWLLVTLVFLLGTVVPGDPARAYAGPGATAETLAAKRVELGLDRPFLERYVEHLGKLATFDLSESVTTRNPVREDLADRVPATLELVVVAALLSVLMGGLVGAATSRARRGSAAIRVLLSAGASIPGFTLGLLLLLLFYGQLDLLPAGGRLAPENGQFDGATGFLLLDGLLAGKPAITFDAAWHLILPAFCLALTPALLTARVFRSSIQSTMRADHVRTVRASGMPESRIFRRHVVRNSLNAPLTILGLTFGVMLGSTAVIELIFGWPGLGLYVSQAVSQSDIPAIAGVTLVVGLAFVLANAIIDIAQTIADPRLRTAR